MRRIETAYADCIVFYGVILSKTSTKDAKRAIGFSSSQTFFMSTKRAWNKGVLLTIQSDLFYLRENGKKWTLRSGKIFNA